MPFVQRVIEPKYLSRTSLFDADGKPLVTDDELDAVANNTLSNALRQLASLVLAANDIFTDLTQQLQKVSHRSDTLKDKITGLEKKVEEYDPKKVAVPESDICTFALLKTHYAAHHELDTNLFSSATRPSVVQELYEAAVKTPIHLMRQLDRWRRDGHRSSRFFLCTPVLGAKRRKIRSRVDIDIETRLPAAIEELRRWTSTEALGDVTVTPDCPNRIVPNVTLTDGYSTDGTVVSDDEAIDHKLPSPEEQLQVVALKFPAEIVAVDVSGRRFDRMSTHRRSLLHADVERQRETDKRTRKPRSRRRNTLAGTDHKEIQDALTAREEPSSAVDDEPEGAVFRSKSSDLLRTVKKDPDKKSHFNSLKQWGKNRLRLMNKSDSKVEIKTDDNSDINHYETITIKRKKSLSKDRKSHERKVSSSSEKSSINLPISTPFSAAMNIAVKLRESSTQRKLRRSGEKDEPHSSSGNWSASSESGRASIGSEITAHPKSTTSTATSSNSLHAPGSANSRRRFVNTSTSSSVTSEGTMTPDIIHDLHEDGETSSVYSCDTEGYYTSFHMDSGLKTLKEEDTPVTPLHSSTAFSNSSSNNTVLSAENEYELFGKGSTSTTTSSAGTVCTTLKAAGSNRSLVTGPAVPERKSSLNKDNTSSGSLDRDSDKTGTVKRSPATKATIVAVVHKQIDGDVSPDSGHNTSSSPIESSNSPNGNRSCSEFEFSESSDMEGPDRIERIKAKTTINSSRIPSMCVITPPQSDDEGGQETNFNFPEFKKRTNKVLETNFDDFPGESKNRVIVTPINGTSKLQLINVNQQSGYATVETVESAPKSIVSKTVRAPSPSGGSVTIREEKKSPSQPIFKATLLPLNNMFGRLKTNLTNFKRDRSKSPNKPSELSIYDSGEYVTIADVKNNNEKASIHTDLANRNLNTVLTGRAREPEYVSLNELPQEALDSLERKKKGARVTLDAEGKVLYSSDSLKRKRGAHTTFEPGPYIKESTTPAQSPLPNHRVAKPIRPVQGADRPLSPQLGKVVIRASSGMASPTAEIVRMPPATIVTPTSPKPVNTRGAYVHIGDAEKTAPVAQRLDSNFIGYQRAMEASTRDLPRDTYRTLPCRKPQYLDADYVRSLSPNSYSSGNTQFHTLGYNRNTYRTEFNPPNYAIQRQYLPQPSYAYHHRPIDQKLGIPVQMPQITNIQYITPQVPYHLTPTKTTVDSPFKSQLNDSIDESFRISPIDPRNSGGFHSSTPSSKNQQELKAAKNLENKLMSPKKSTMSNEELYAAIHKNKKKLNIHEELSDRGSPGSVSPCHSENSLSARVATVKSPETGYLGEKSRSRYSWSPNNGEYVDFTRNIDKLSPQKEPGSRQSWACNDRKGNQQTSRLDFKKLLLQHGSKTGLFSGPAKKLSAVEQLKISKQQVQPVKSSDMNILELSGSPKNLNRKFVPNPPGSPKNTPEKPRPKLMSPRSQWRFTNPRTDVLSSTILEDCREDESPNSSNEKKTPNRTPKQGSIAHKKAATVSESANRESHINKGEGSTVPISQYIRAQRAQFFNSPPDRNPGSYGKYSPKGGQNSKECSSPPTLETAF